MNFRRRSLFFIVLGVSLAIVGSFIEPNALGGGAVENGFGRVIALLGVFAFVAFLGVFPLLNRGMMTMTNWIANSYNLQRWQSICDSEFGPFLIWYVGIDRQGNRL